MNQVPPILTLREDDVKLMLACQVHTGHENVDSSMLRYVHKRNDKGINIIDIRKTWEKLVLAARAIVAVEHPKDICVVALSPASQPSFAQRAVLKFAHHIGCRSIAGRITPGTFTNQRQVHYMEPRLLITSDPRIDHQPIMEASYVNLPVISFANTHHNLRGIDIAIPCNTSGKTSIALMYWLLAREVLRLRDSIPRDKDWDVMVDMFVYRDPEEAEKQQTEVDFVDYGNRGGYTNNTVTEWGDNADETEHGDDQFTAPQNEEWGADQQPWPSADGGDSYPDANESWM